MADTGGQEKTEAPTPRKRQEAREEGNVPKSQELSTVVLLIVALIMFYLFAPRTFHMLRLIVMEYHGHMHEIDVTEDTLPGMAWKIVKEIGLIVYPFAIALILSATAINLAQVGFLLSGKAMKPKASRLSPLEGVKRIFSARGAMDLAKSLFKLSLVAPMMYYTIISEVPILASLADEPVRDIFIHLGMTALRVISRALVILFILALLDFAFQRFQHERDLKMSKQEVKEEQKRTQGDPQIKARIRQVQREVARRRMMAKVPEAEVVVTNPTEYAIALAYNKETHDAPVVLAKGRGLIARKIKEIAREAGVPIYEDRPLAQLLDKLVDVGDTITPELYESVARVLAFVYQLKNKSETSKQAAGF